MANTRTSSARFTTATRVATTISRYVAVSRNGFSTMASAAHSTPIGAQFIGPGPGDGRDDGFEDHECPAFGRDAMTLPHQFHWRWLERNVVSPMRGPTVEACPARDARLLAAVRTGRQTPTLATVPWRKRSSMAYPYSLAADSGWNCTPTTGCVAMLHGHDFAFVAGRAITRSTAGSESARDDERVIARDAERRRQTGEDARAIVRDERRSAVHAAGRRARFAAVRRADALMAQAHAEDRHRRTECAGRPRSRCRLRPASRDPAR